MVFLLGLQAEVPLTAAVFSELRAVKDYFSCTAVLNVYLMNFAGRVASILLSHNPQTDSRCPGTACAEEASNICSQILAYQKADILLIRTSELGVSLSGRDHCWK